MNCIICGEETNTMGGCTSLFCASNNVKPKTLVVGASIYTTSKQIGESWEICQLENDNIFEKLTIMTEQGIRLVLTKIEEVTHHGERSYTEIVYTPVTIKDKEIR